MTSALNINPNLLLGDMPRLPLGLRLRLFAARLMAVVAPDADVRCRAEHRFADITRNQGSLVAGICLSFAKSREEFEDLRQDVFLNIWRGINNFREDSSISTWVYRVALNTCISSQRKNKGGERQAEALNEFYREVFDETSAEDLERYELMYGLIARLSPLDKSTLLMWLDDKSYDEIAEVIGLSRNAVASRLKRAKDRLAAMASNSVLFNN